MKTKQQLLLAYDAGRRNLLIMTLLTAANAVLSLFESPRSFLFAAFLPNICIIRAKYGNPWLPEAAVILLGCVLPIAIWIACWVLSDKRRYGWLKLAGALYALDTVYMIYFFLTYGFDFAYILTIPFHALILWQIIRASVAAKRLATGDFVETPPGAAQAPAYGDASGAAAQGAVQTAAPAIFYFDRGYASSTGANKTGRIALTCLIFFAWMMGGAFLCI